MSPIFQCNRCGQIFNDGYSLEFHRKTENRAMTQESNSWVGCACPTCSGYCGCGLTGHHTDSQANTQASRELAQGTIDSLDERINEIFSDVWMAGHDYAAQKGGLEVLRKANEKDREAMSKAKKAILELFRTSSKEARLDELEKLSWHKDHPPEYSGHDSGSITLADRIEELENE